MRCRVCAVILPDTARFCLSCGTPVDETSEPPPVQKSGVGQVVVVVPTFYEGHVAELKSRTTDVRMRARLKAGAPSTIGTAPGVVKAHFPNVEAGDYVVTIWRPDMSEEANSYFTHEVEPGKVTMIDRSGGAYVPIIE